MKDDQKTLSLLERIAEGIANLGKPKVKNMLELQDEVSGETLMFPNLEPDQEITVGETVSIADGDYVVNGQKIKVESNAITEIEAVEVEEEAVDMVDEEKEKMAKELEEALDKLFAKEKEIEDLKNSLADKSELEKQLKEVKAMVSVEDVEATKRSPKEPTVKTGSNFSAVLNQLKNRK